MSVLPPTQRRTQSSAAPRVQGGSPDRTPGGTSGKDGAGQVPVSHAAARPGARLTAALQDDIALRHLDIAESVARSFASSGPEASDIRQVAYLGLIKAVQRFDPARGVPFASFAVPTINGEIKRYLRDSCWVIRPPREIQDLRTEIARAAPALAQRFGREATARELGLELGHPEGRILEAQAAHSSLRPESLDAEGPGWAETLAVEASGTDRSDDMISLRGAVNDLGPGEKELLYRRYFMEQTQQVIADALGMSQMQVSRALSRILVRLQKTLLGSPAQARPAALPSRAPGRTG